MSNSFLIRIFEFTLSAVSGIGTSIAVNLVPTFTEFHRFESIVVVWLSASAADNLLITISLVLSLVCCP